MFRAIQGHPEQSIYYDTLHQRPSEWKTRPDRCDNKTIYVDENFVLLFCFSILTCGLWIFHVITTPRFVFVPPLPPVFTCFLLNCHVFTCFPILNIFGVGYRHQTVSGSPEPFTRVYYYFIGLPTIAGHDLFIMKTTLTQFCRIPPIPLYNVSFPAYRQSNTPLVPLFTQ